MTAPLTRSAIAIAAAGLLLTACSAPAPGGDSDDPLAPYVENGLRVAIANEVPWSYLDGDELKGAEGDLIEYCADQLGIDKVDVSSTDWDGLLPGLGSNRWDVVVAGMSITDERLQVGITTQQLYGYGSKILVLEGNPLGIHSWSDAAASGEVLGIIAGGSYQEAIEALGVKLSIYPNFDAMIADMNAGRITMAATAELSLSDYVANNPDSGFEVADPWDYEGISLSSPGWYFAKGKEALRDAVNECVTGAKEDGTLAGLLEEYGFDPSTITEPGPGFPES
ncbi:MAG: transporter substrate-binding domain-containing protein [Microbacteriaceae bacterium]|nr:transporter substrate-binding domain-containing protein [Microbacteriaceae bacterium]